MRWILSLVIWCLASASVMAQSPSGYRITTKDIEDSVKDYLIEEGAGEAVEVELTGKLPSILFSYDKPVAIYIDEIDYDARARRWHGEFSFYHKDSMLHHMSMAGRYDELVTVPVLVDRLHSKDTISEHDIEWVAFTEKRLREDTVMSAEELVGKSPRRVISPGRPIRVSELQAPIVLYRGDLVQMVYNVHNMDIRTMGEAQEDGAIGRLIRVKNLDSGVIVQAVVTGPNRVEVSKAGQIRE